MSDAFNPPAEAAAEAPAKVPRTYAPGEIPSIGDLFNDTIEDFGENLAPYALAGLAYMGVTLIVVFVSIFILYAGMFGFMFGGMAAGIAIGGDAGGLVASLISVGGMFLTFFAFMFVMMAILMPMHASLERAMQKHIRGEAELSFAAPFSTMFADLPRILAVTAIAMLASMVGICFFYVGAFFAAWVLFWSGSFVALDKMGPIEALGTSARRVTGDPGGVGVHTIVCFLISMVAGYVPVIGPMFAIAFKVRMHDALFPEA